MRTSTPIKSEPLLVNEREAAQLLGVSPRTVWSLNASGELRSVRIGRCKRYDLADLLAYIARKKEGGDA